MKYIVTVILTVFGLNSCISDASIVEPHEVTIKGPEKTLRFNVHAQDMERTMDLVCKQHQAIKREIKDATKFTLNADNDTGEPMPEIPIELND